MKVLFILMYFLELGCNNKCILLLFVILWATLAKCHSGITWSCSPPAWRFMSHLLPGVPVVRLGRVHRQHGDLWSRSGRQVGRRSGSVASTLLPTALHTRLRVLHQGSLSHMSRPGLHIYTGQFSRSLQSLSRYARLWIGTFLVVNFQHPIKWGVFIC